jgi:hypothetical protein
VFWGPQLRTFLTSEPGVEELALMKWTSTQKFYSVMIEKSSALLCVPPLKLSSHPDGSEESTEGHPYRAETGFVENRNFASPVPDVTPKRKYSE